MGTIAEVFHLYGKMKVIFWGRFNRYMAGRLCAAGLKKENREED